MGDNAVKRIDIVNTCGGHCWDTKEDDTGEFVWYEDYEALLKRVQHLEKLLKKYSED